MASVITVDGPSGVGKGTISHLLAQRLGWHFLDSGALYRLVGLAAHRQGIAFDDDAALARLAATLPAEFKARGEGMTILLDGDEVTDTIRTETCGSYASLVAAVPTVREALLQRQRDYRQSPGLIADGRDMGTTIFPDADAKIFLDASARVRAERRYKQLMEKGLGANISDLIADIEKRDERDRNRSVSPLRPADDALVIDTSSQSIGEVFDKVVDYCRQCLGDGVF